MREASPELHRSNLEFQRLLEKLPAAAYTSDAQGFITYFNRHAVDVWGREPVLNDPVDRFCGSFKLYSSDGTRIPHAMCWMALALQNEQEYNGHEIIIERPDGTRRTALAHANPFYDRAGRVSGAVNVLVDITDRKRAEDLLRETDRRKSEFLATLAQELHNPLAPLRNGLQILRLAKHDAAAIEQASDMMERQVLQMVRLIDDLLDLSRINNGKAELRKERIDLSAAVQDAIETSRLAIKAARHEFTVRFPSPAVYVDADRVRLSQTIANLLNNSAKYTPRGGHIRLTVEQQGSDAVVKVKDNGVGLSAEMIPRVFDMFTQASRSMERSEGGLGIGLSLVRGLIEMHGGSVEAHSDGPGLGSEFVVRLPALLTPAPTQQQPGEFDDFGKASKYKILVVDDNKDSALSLGMMLRIMGHEIQIAHDSLEAVERAAAFRPSVIVLDIGLPKLNGYEVCRRIREQEWVGSVVIIAATGWGQEEDRRRAKEAGFNFHLVKPIAPAALAKLLSGLLLAPL